MWTSHPPRNKKDRSVRRQKHDPYKAKGKLREPSVCRQCKAMYHKGRWTWDPVPLDSYDIVCPACERIRDNAPSGVLLLTGEFVAKHRDEILGLARNEEARVKAEHPLARIIRVENQAETPQRGGHHHDRPSSRTARWRGSTSRISRHIDVSV